MKWRIIILTMCTAAVFSCKKECNCDNIQLQPNTWVVNDSTIHASKSTKLDTTSLMTGFSTTDTGSRAPRIIFQFYSSPASGTYKVVRHPEQPDEIAIFA